MPRIIPRSVQVLLVLSVLWALSTAASAQPAAAPTATPSGADLESAIHRETLGQFWGAIIVAKDGEPILAAGWGIDNPDDLQPITTRHLFDIGSVSKQFTAAALLRLQEQQKLDLDDRVSKFFGVIEGEELDDGGITLRQLLTHTSGMSDRASIQRLDFPDRDDAVERAFAPARRAKPGEHFEYCNAGYIVLAAVIEKVSGERFEDFVEREVFAKAGMSDTGFLDAADLNNRPHTARVIGDGTPRARTAGTFDDGWGWGLRGAGGIITTAEDMVRWDRALASGKVLSEASLAEMFTPAQQNYALGWVVGQTASGAAKQSHGGATRGYRAEFARYPEADITIAVLTNERHNPTKLLTALESTLFPPPKETQQITLHTGGLDLNEHKVAILGPAQTAAAHWIIESTPDTVRLALMRDPDLGPVATFILSPSVAQRLVREARFHVQRHNAAPGAAQRPMDITIATRPYRNNAEGVVHLPEKLMLTVMPQYVSMDERGQRSVDPRPTLVIIDEAAGFWPLIVRMDHAQWAEWADQVDAAVKK